MVKGRRILTRHVMTIVRYGEEMFESSEKAAYFDAWDAETMQACVCDSRCARDAPPLHLCHGR